MIVLDTTVLVYAEGSEHPLRDPCRALIATIAAGDVTATTAVRVIQELVHVPARRRERTDAAAMGRDYAELLSPLLPVGGEHLERGLALSSATRASALSMRCWLPLHSTMSAPPLWYPPTAPSPGWPTSRT